MNTVSRELILSGLEQLNAAENQSAELGLDAKVAAIDSTMAVSWEGWTNGQHSVNRAAERETERVLYQVFPDYQRKFDLVVVDAPYANVLWTITATATTNGYKLRMEGSTTFEFDLEGKIIRSWLYTNDVPNPSDVGLKDEGT